MAYLGLMKVDNHDVTMVIDTYTGNVSVDYSAEEIKSGNISTSVEFPGFNRDALKEIRLYRRWKTICVDKVTSENFDLIATVEGDFINFSEALNTYLIRNSKSYFVERVIYSEMAFIIFVILHIILGAIEEKIDPQNRNNHGPIYETKKFFAEVKEYWQYMAYAANADLKAEVANSYLNRLWWILEPLFSMLVYVIVFGRVMGKSVENYATFVFSALLMWSFFQKIILFSVRCVRLNRDILTKVYVPKHVLLISNMILNMYKLLFSLIVLIPMLFIFKVHVGINALWLIPAYILMITISFAGGMILLHYGVYVDDLGYAVGILMQMLMFLSGIFYDVITSLPVPLNNIMICINPVAMMIDTMRNALLYNVVSNVPIIIVWFVLSILFSYIGIHIVYKNENGYAKVI